MSLLSMWAPRSTNNWHFSRLHISVASTRRDLQFCVRRAGTVIHHNDIYLDARLDRQHKGNVLTSFQAEYSVPFTCMRCSNICAASTLVLRLYSKLQVTSHRCDMLVCFGSGIENVHVMLRLGIKACRMYTLETAGPVFGMTWRTRTCRWTCMTTSECASAKVLVTYIHVWPKMYMWILCMYLICTYSVKNIAVPYEARCILHIQWWGHVWFIQACHKTS